MGQRDLIKIICRLLEKYQIDYLLTGSLAVSYYGYPRATHDIDIILEIQKKNWQNLARALEKLGKPFIIDREEIKEAVKKSSQLNLYHPQTGIKIDFWIVKDNEFERNKFKRIKEIFLDRQKIKLVSPEDLILTKLSWSKKIRSERHLNDCAGIMKVQAEKLEKRYLSLWAEKLKVKHLLEEVQLLNLPHLF